MLTPQEIKDKTFIRAVFGGYDMTAVDDFMLPLCEDYAALYKENSILKGKLKVLVETVEEYRSVDEAMRKALLAAQKMAHETMEDAHKKSRSLMDEAEEKAREKIEGLREEIIAEQKKLELARARTARFIAEAAALHRAQIEMLERIPDMQIPPPEQKTAAINIKKAAEEIDQNLNAKFSEESRAETLPETLPETDSNQDSDDEETKVMRVFPKGNADYFETPDGITSKSVSDFTVASKNIDDALNMKVFEFTIGEKTIIDDEITSELPPLDDDDNFTGDINPPPRYDFENLQFGKDYSLKK